MIRVGAFLIEFSKALLTILQHEMREVLRSDATHDERFQIVD